MSYVEHHDVVETGDMRTDTRVATSRLVFSPGQIIAGTLGLVTAVIGVITVSRGGIDGSMNVPMVRVAGLDQSAMLGAIELGLGLLLILGALSVAARGLIVGIGVVMVLGGVLLGAANSTILRDVGTVHGTGWVIMVGGIVAIVAGSLGRMIRTSHSVKTT
ncbi:MAG TPA: hypothetical protein VK771_05705 [Acidimicrobiia bacterium]|jgi:hypothetical protein|nr:hypothetical protein [Acidimicrobiia bacterium]